MNNHFSKLVKSLQIITILILFSFSNNTNAQTYVTWTYGPSGSITGTFPGGTVTASVTGIGAGINLSIPSSYTQFLNVTGNRTFSTFGGKTNTPSKKLTFTFSTPVIVTKFNMNDIDKGSEWNDSFVFENITYTSTTCTNCVSTINGVTATSTSGAVDEYGSWFDSTPVSSFSLNYLTTNNLTHAFLGYSMEVMLPGNTVSVNNSIVCAGQTSTISATNSLAGTYSYSWTVPSGATNPGNVDTFTTDIPGAYSVVVTNTATGQIYNSVAGTVTVSPFINNTFNPILPICAGETLTLPTASNEGITGTWSPLIDNTQTVTYTFTPTSNLCSSIEQITVVVNPLINPTVASPQQFCIQDNATLSDIIISGTNIKWYSNSTGGSVLPFSTLLQNGVTYYATQTLNNCESNRVPVQIQIQNTMAPSGNMNQRFCSTDNATLNSIAISGSNIQWYNSATSTTPLPNNTLLLDGVTYFATQTLNNCESTTRLAVTIEIIFTLNATNYSKLVCDELNDETETVNLSNFNSYLLATTGNVFSYYHSPNGAANEIASEEITNYANYDLNLGIKVFYVRIVAPNTCYQVVELSLELISAPFVFIDENLILCEGSQITINAGTGFDSYLWSTNETSPSIIVTQPGNYSVTVSENHGSVSCSTTTNFTVILSNIATITETITTDWTVNENTLEILVTGVGIYEYSINGIDYQDSSIFTNLQNGEYTVYVRDKNGCGVNSEDVYLLMHPKYFTPNGDGFNDYWQIKFSENEPNLKITIFDRQGKFITQFGPNNLGWNGTHNNEPLPSTDYWFVVKRENGKEHRGHFTLKR